MAKAPDSAMTVTMSIIPPPGSYSAKELHDHAFPAQMFLGTGRPLDTTAAARAFTLTGPRSAGHGSPRSTCPAAAQATHGVDGRAAHASGGELTESESLDFGC